MGKVTEEYYLQNNRLIFAYEKQTNYNRPFYYDSAQMVINNDTEFHHPKWFEEVEIRSWFNTDGLVHYAESNDCGAPFARDYLKEVGFKTLSRVKELVAAQP
jgi:hypothetical protein